MTEYNHLEIEKKWQNIWEESQVFKADNNTNKPTYYALGMFPFPSGAGLHVGHPEGYTATDILSRFKRMNGYEVLHPMGWDAFGLPTENYAIKTGIQPSVATKQNVANFTKQIKSLGFSYDWDREVNTTDPDYYKWTQELFLKFYKKGLLYEENKPMNWCPVCNVVCANEEVENGLHERCGTPVEKKALKQWMFKITDYADRLINDLEDPNVILIHGLGGNGDHGWQNDIVKYFKKEKIDCFSPNFPNANNPRYIEWKTFFEKSVLPKINQNSIIFGHSLGGGFLQKYLSENELKVSELVLVAPTVGHCNLQEIKNFFNAPFNYEKVKKSADKIFILAGGKDPYIKTEEFQFLAEKLNAQLKFTEKEEHFWGDHPLSAFLSKDLEQSCKNIANAKLDWPEKIKAIQRNWIGKSSGIEIDYKIDGFEETLTCYTTRPDTNFGATFLVLAPEHKFLQKNIDKIPNKVAVDAYIKEAAAKSDIDRMANEKTKTGVNTGCFVISHLTGEKLPLYVGDFVLANVGTGAVIGVPGHDQRDFEFAQAMGDIEIKRVVISTDGDKSKITKLSQVQDQSGSIINSDFLNGLTITDAKEKIMDFMEEKGFGKRVTNFKLRDWIFTRQRYWGEPIPLAFDEAGNCHSIASSELPITLPKTENYKPSSSGESPLSKIEDWANFTGYIDENGDVKKAAKNEVPNGHKLQNFTRETSTMPNWAGSSWYWLRYMDAQNDQEAWSQKSAEKWGAVDLYVGGTEHAVLHLLYGRFWHKALYDMGLVPSKEPFKKLVNQGLILSYAYQNKNGGLVPVDEVEEKDGKFFKKDSQEPLTKITAKMSKSLKNVVNPDDIVNKYGADTLRVYEMFMGPFEQNKAWSTESVEGTHKFLMRIWRCFMEKDIQEACPNKELIILTHQTVKKVTEDIQNFKFNTAISQLMIWVNAYSKLDAMPKIAGSRFIRLLAPFAPHLAEEIWQQKFKPEAQTLTFENWPKWETKYLTTQDVTYAIQVNGKVRGNLTIDKSTNKEDSIKAAKELEKIQNYLAEGDIKKEIFVPGKIIGFVVK